MDYHGLARRYLVARAFLMRPQLNSGTLGRTTTLVWDVALRIKHMAFFDHKNLIKRLVDIDRCPDESAEFDTWLQARPHLDFLNRNAMEDDVLVNANGEFSFVNSVVVPNARLTPLDEDDLLGWNFNAHRGTAAYVSGGGKEGVWVERGLDGTGTQVLEGAIQLIFVRSFEGQPAGESRRCELTQEYAHLTGSHWLDERSAYCRFDERGDLEAVVSVTNDSSGLFVTFQRRPLEEYLAATDSSLVRLFDFTLFRKGRFAGWPGGQDEARRRHGTLVFRQLALQGNASYARGFQVLRPLRSKESIFADITGASEKDREHAEFLAHDWRNGQLCKISTAPGKTTNYFEASANSLPFELSPAYFRPAVVQKYKADKDKYSINEWSISCRAAWRLKSYDVNEAGQVHAYIRDLRRLPYEEQLHWLSFNEAPKTGISERAFKCDFAGEFAQTSLPLQQIIATVLRWRDDKIDWWLLRDEGLLNNLAPPISDSIHEWSESFMDVAKLVVEGLQTKAIRRRLDGKNANYDKQSGTIILLEQLFECHRGRPVRLDGLRTVQSIRSKVRGHVGGSEAKQLAKDALSEHETFARHFQHVCSQVADELARIEDLLSGKFENDHQPPGESA